MPRFAYVNGRYARHNEASVHIEDRGYQFADGVYEVIACIDGDLADERGHLDRLERSLGEIGMGMPVSRQTLAFIMREVLDRNRLKNANVYIQVTRGVSKRDFPFPQNVKPALVVTARPFTFDDGKVRETGIAVKTVRDIRWKRRDIKSVALLAQVLAKQQAIEAGAAEAWMLDDKGFITEGASSNAWIITSGGKIVTRMADQSILRGVTRTALERIMHEKALTLEERSFSLEEAYEAAEAFNSSAVALIAPVVRIDDRPVGNGRPGPVSLKLYDQYRNYVMCDKEEQVHWQA